jgi:hypothetical protein
MVTAPMFAPCGYWSFFIRLKINFIFRGNENKEISDIMKGLFDLAKKEAVRISKLAVKK